MEVKKTKRCAKVTVKKNRSLRRGKARVERCQMLGVLTLPFRFERRCLVWCNNDDGEWIKEKDEDGYTLAAHRDEEQQQGTS